jgi:hypothetical protein
LPQHRCLHKTSPANHFPCQAEHLRHCEAVIALVADEDLAVAADQQLRQRGLVLKALALQVANMPSTRL